MNGFANGIMSMLLGWIRVFVNNLWKLLTSPDGDTLYRFMSEHWKLILLIVIAAGLVIDRVVYFLRWRPDYIWAGRRAERRRRRTARSIEQADDYNGNYDAPEEHEPPAPSQYAPPEAATRVSQPVNYTYAPQDAATRVSPALHTTYGNQGVFAPPAQAHIDTEQYKPPIQIQKNTVQPIYAARGATPISDAFGAATAKFAPMARVAPQMRAPRRDAEIPQSAAEPIFDDEPPTLPVAVGRGLSAAYMRGAAYNRRMSTNPAQGMVNSFGNAMPEPVEYLRDMQAGFAPQLPSERLYPRGDDADARRAEEPPRSQVHPGLNSDAFRQSFGLDAATGEAAHTDSAQRLAEHDEASAAFTPYAQAYDETRLQKRSNPFTTIAKKARTLVGVEDDEHKLTIHDLQPTVDMRKAFHEPVYPRPKPDDGGEG